MNWTAFGGRELRVGFDLRYLQAIKQPSSSSSQVYNSRPAKIYRHHSKILSSTRLGNAAVQEEITGRRNLERVHGT